ncbi:MAG: amidohydrolase family protein [Chloroflexi bacterium]|nr:amidohydrolase family protein [Chloroflexota bacterium]
MRRILLLSFLFITACGLSSPEESPTKPVIQEASPTELIEETTLPEVAPPEEAADVIFHGGNILTMDENIATAQALAIKGEEIVAVGSDEDLMMLQGEKTILIALEGRTLMPGFVDAHTHLLNDADHYGMDWNGMQQLALENGITTFSNMYTTPEFLEGLQNYHAEGGLRTRVSLYLNYNTNCGDPIGTWWKDVPSTREFGEMLRIGGVKIFADGGSCKNPALSYETFPGSGLGNLFITGEQIAGVVSEAQEVGHQVAIHAIGDRAIEASLDGIESALNGAPNTFRHRIEHNAILRPDLLPRYSEIGIVATIFGTFPACTPFDNPSPAPYNQWEWAWNTLIDTNPDMHIAWHGDDPFIHPVNPILELYGLLTRKQVTEDRGTVCDSPEWLQDDTLTVEKALPMMTRESAYALFRDEEVGKLAPGLLADVIILSENPISENPDILLDTYVLMTMVGGKVEFCAAGNENLCPTAPPPIIESENGNSIPFGYLDTPAPDEKISGTYIIAGWALDDAPIDRIELYLDGEYIGDAFYGVPRPDVASDYPDNDGAPNFGYSFDLDTSQYENGTHTLSALAFGASGNEGLMYPDEVSFMIEN